MPSTLTPDESSDDDIKDDRLHASLAVHDIPKPNTASTYASTKANASEADFIDAARLPGGSWKSPYLSRRRANGISAMTPPPMMNFATNTEQPDSKGARIPTPIYGHFTSTDVNMDSSEAAMNSFIHPGAALSQFRHCQNVLSPMMSEEGESEADWWRRRRLPSPVESPMMPTRMETDDLASPSVMDVLSFENIRSHNMQMMEADAGNPSSPQFMMERRPVEGSGSRGDQQPKKGKLVMGYRADCDKCQKRLPRHYSHIIWD